MHTDCQQITMCKRKKNSTASAALSKYCILLADIKKCYHKKKKGHRKLSRVIPLECICSIKFSLKVQKIMQKIQEKWKCKPLQYSPQVKIESMLQSGVAWRFLTGIKTKHGMLEWGKEILSSRLAYCHLSLPRNIIMSPSGLEWDFYYKISLIASGSQDVISTLCGKCPLCSGQNVIFPTKHWASFLIIFFIELLQNKSLAVLFPKYFQNMMLTNSLSKLLQSCKSLQGLSESKKQPNCSYRVFKAPLV